MADDQATLPKPASQFLSHLSEHPDTPTRELLQPYLAYETWLRKEFAKDDLGDFAKEDPEDFAKENPRDDPVKKSHGARIAKFFHQTWSSVRSSLRSQDQARVTQPSRTAKHYYTVDNFANLVPIYAGHETSFRIRTIDRETADEEKYLMPVPDKLRPQKNTIAIAGSHEEYKARFRAFTHDALMGLNWSNIVVAGSSALLPLLSLREEYKGEPTVQKPLESYYQTVADSSDIDIFLYGMDTEDAAIARIFEIEAVLRTNQRLPPNTGLTMRTKNAITFISPRWPYRHVQVILRLYRSISEILTGFDIDCACVAYDGGQVYSNPRGITAIATRTNTIDLSRRSPSYENRLWKYRSHNFEVFWDSLDRSRVNMKQRFKRREWPNFPFNGLARLLYYEHVCKRRHNFSRSGRTFRKVDGGGGSTFATQSGYSSFTIPYSRWHTAQRIREHIVYHSTNQKLKWTEPFLFGTAKEVIIKGAKPSNKSKGQLAGKVTFIKDNPGRQMIGSFYPLDDDDWTEIAYRGNDQQNVNIDEELTSTDEESSSSSWVSTSTDTEGEISDEEDAGTDREDVSEQ